MPRRWRPRWEGRCTRWRTPWSLMSLLSSGKGSRCALIDPVKGVKHLATALRKHRFCLPVPMLWKFCMTKHAIFYINWIFSDKTTSPHITFSYVFTYIGFRCSVFDSLSAMPPPYWLLKIVKEEAVDWKLKALGGHLLNGLPLRAQHYTKAREKWFVKPQCKFTALHQKPRL